VVCALCFTCPGTERLPLPRLALQANMGAKNHAVVMPDANVEATTSALVSRDSPLMHVLPLHIKCLRQGTKCAHLLPQGLLLPLAAGRSSVWRGGAAVHGHFGGGVCGRHGAIPGRAD